MEASLSGGVGSSAGRCGRHGPAENAGGTRAPAQGKPKTQTPSGNPKKSDGHTLGPAAGRYALIQLMAQQYPIKDVCQALRVPRSSYYAWLNRTPSPRQAENESLRKTLAELFVANRRV